MDDKNRNGKNTSSKNATHYEILGIPENSSSKDIRNAFVDLSKSYHPDKNPEDRKLHEKFVKLNEAYSILSKTDSKRTYDLNLSYQRQGRTTINGKPITDHDFWGPNVTYHSPWRDESLWEHRDRSKDSNFDHNSYYGIKGVKRVSNGWIASGAVFVLALGAVLHYYAYSKAKLITMNQLNLRDQHISRILKETRQRADENSFERQIEILENSIKNPTLKSNKIADSNGNKTHLNLRSEIPETDLD